MGDSKYRVTKKAKRPADSLERCFYCHKNVEDYHKEDCVLIKRKVKVKMIVEYNTDVPNFWDKDKIEFHRNDGTWCSDNAIEEIREFVGEDECICGITKFEYLRDIGTSYIEEE